MKQRNKRIRGFFARLLTLTVVLTQFSGLIIPSRALAAVPVDVVGIDGVGFDRLIRGVARALGYDDTDAVKLPFTDPGHQSLRKDVVAIQSLLGFYNVCPPGDPADIPALGFRYQNCLPQILKAINNISFDEVFLFNLFNFLSVREQSFIKSFELQKIEKAREDVNKLIFEVETELVDQGTIVNQPDPLTGASRIIKKPGRIIHNVEDFVYEEPIQKARDFIYCYFGGDLSLPPASTPWKLLPLGETNAESIRIQRELRDHFLAYVQRKNTYRVTAPPEEWYTEAICNQIMESFPADSACFEPGNPACQNDATIAQIDFLPTLNQSLSQIKNTRGYFTIDEFNEYDTNPNNNIAGIKKSVQGIIDGIIRNYTALRSLEYLAGQGIRSEKVLIGEAVPGSTDEYYFYDTEYIISPAIILLQKMQAAAQSQFDLAQLAYMDLPATTDPAILSAYNLTRGPSVPVVDSTGNAVATLDGWVKPRLSNDTLKFRTTVDPSLSTTLTGLPAPWEDTSAYNKLPLTREGRVESYDPKNYTVPANQASLENTAYNYFGNLELDSIPGNQPPLSPTRLRALFPSYQWFTSVVEMYELGPKFGISLWGTGALNRGWNILLNKWFGNEDAPPYKIDWDTFFLGLPAP